MFLAISILRFDKKKRELYIVLACLIPNVSDYTNLKESSDVLGTSLN